jgi:hypothetical protein
MLLGRRLRDGLRRAVRGDRRGGGADARRRPPARERARRRVRGAAPAQDADLAEQRRVVDAFLAAARSGDFGALVAVLDPDILFRVDARRGDRPPVQGEAVARQVLSRGRAFAPLARPAVVNGAAGAVVGTGPRPFAVIGFTVARGRIVAIDVVA